MATQSIGLQKDMRKIVREVRRRGFDVKIGGSGHYRIVDPKTGQYLGTMAVSPSDRRAIDRTVSDLSSRGVLDGDPRKKERKKIMAEKKRNRGQPSSRQMEVRDKLLQAMTQMGWQPGKRTGVQSQVARELVEASDGKTMTTLDGATWAVKETIKAEQAVGGGLLDAIETWADDYMTRPDQPPVAEDTAPEKVEEDKPWQPLFTDTDHDYWLEVWAYVTEGLSAPRDGRKAPYGAVRKLEELVHAWGEATGISLTQTFGNRIWLSMSHADERMYPVYVEKAKRFLRDFHNGWRPKVVEEPDERESDEYWEQETPAEEQDVAEATLTTLNQKATASTWQTTDANEWEIHAAPAQAVSDGMPVHIKALAMMIKEGDSTHQVWEKMQIAKEIMELEATRAS